jgi:hypothetical protein
VKLSPNLIACLSVVLLENKRTNDFTHLKRIRELVGDWVVSSASLTKLINLGLLNKAGYDLYVISESGEYFLRDIETMLGRIVDNKPFSVWRKIQSEDDPRLKYVRRPRVKSAKLVDAVKKPYVSKKDLDNPAKHVFEVRPVWDEWRNPKPYPDLSASLPSVVSDGENPNID